VILLLPVILSACNLFKTTPITRDIALADLDGDGDLDAFFANGQSESLQPNSVWINLGGGEFMDSGQALGKADTWSIVLGDLDGDGDLDAFEGGWGFLYINNGHGRFTTEDRAIPMAQGSYTRYAALGDLDQDGDLDLTLAGCCGAFARLNADESASYSAFLSRTFTDLLNLSFGFFLFFLLEKLLWRHCHRGKCGVHPFAYVNLIGDGVHNFIDGLVIAASFVSNVQSILGFIY